MLKPKTQFELDYGYNVELAKRMVNDIYKAPEQRQDAKEFLAEVTRLGESKPS